MKKNLQRLIKSVCVLALGLSSSKMNAQAGTALNLQETVPVDQILLPSAISTASLTNGNKITVETWARPTTTAGLAAIVGNYSNPANNMQFLLRRTNNVWEFMVGNGTTGQYSGTVTAAGTVSLNTWQHVAGVYNGTVVSIYINGALSATAAASYTFGPTGNSILVATDGVPESYTGDLDEMRIWNVARTKCQINTFMNCEIPASATGLIANYHFNQGIAAGNNATVTTLSDASGNAYTGTLTNVALTGSISNWIAPGGVVSGFTTSLAPPSFTATNLSPCAGQTIALGGVAGNTYSWTGGINNGVSFTPSVSSSYTFIGTNTVTSCSNTAVANVTVNSNPVISVNSGSICSGSSFTITPSGASTYTIQGGNAVVSPTVSSSYSVIGTSSAGCVSQSVAVSNVSVAVCTGLSESSNEFSGLNIYPNPSNGIYNIDLPIAADMKIYNSIGQVIYTEKMNSGKNTINLHQHSTGIYIIQFSNSHNKVNYRIVKQ